MSFLDLLQPPDPQPAFLYPELANIEQLGVANQVNAVLSNDEILVFQYWPETISDEYITKWNPKDIPGGSHPLYQWTGGGGRTISFDVVFTAEIDEGLAGRLGGAGRSLAAAAPAALLPSSRYTVNVAAAVAKIRSFQMGDYNGGTTLSVSKPPPRLHLVLPGSQIGGDGDSEIFCILLSAPVTYESFFPSGAPRIVTLSLSFAEIVQRGSGQEARIRFIGAGGFAKLGKGYKYRGGLERSTGV